MRSATASRWDGNIRQREPAPLRESGLSDEMPQRVVATVRYGSFLRARILVSGCGAIGADRVVLLDYSLAVYRAVRGARDPFALGDVAEGSTAARGVLRARFAGRGDIARAGALQRGLGCIDLLGGAAVNRQESSAAFDCTFVTLRFVFGDAH